MNMNAVTKSAGRSIGEILIDAGLIDMHGAERILRLQKEEHLRFGDAAVKLGLVSAADLQLALSNQFDYPYLPLNAGSPLGEELIAAYRPFSPLVEQLRSLRSQLLLRWFERDAGRNVLAIAGTARGEGRSYLAANLAVVFSQLGERTLLIDADLRFPRQHELFKLENRLGLSNLLAGRANVQEAIVPIAALKSLDLLPAGTTPPNPVELLTRPVFAELLAQVGRDYDAVLIDTSAHSNGADANTVVAHAGAALLVTRNNETRLAKLRAMVDGFTHYGVKIVGSVFNAPPLLNGANAAAQD